MHHGGTGAVYGTAPNFLNCCARKLSAEMAFTNFVVEYICRFLILIIRSETIDAAVVVVAARGYLG